jgi:hydroxymethylpyrimidine pyrophosphatase-like HAD family hydrolase/fructoselysine-6-P-deglycase FrlB-like protein
VGKPYALDLRGLNNTYSWAIAEDIQPLQSALGETGSLPLLAVGSGGSFSAADFATYLHEKRSGKLAKAVTPLEVISQSSLKDVAVLLLSAGGKNPDIIAAFQRLVRREPRQFVVLCASTHSPLSELAKSYGYVECFTFAGPARRDGFLATNTLLSFAVLLTRAYGRPCDPALPLPSSLGTLVHPKQSAATYTASLRKICSGLWNRETLLVLHGCATHAAAMDLESKFSEAALGPVQLADYRNFAHGRHNWLAKRGNTTGVIALISNEDREIAERTLKLIPSGVLVARIKVALSGAKAGIAAFVTALHIVGQAGESRGIDPGRPGVPSFGRKIYHLKIWPNTRSDVSSAQVVAIERKAGVSFADVPVQELNTWKRGYEDFVRKVEHSRFAGIVFDYDGTLCSKHDRYTGVSGEVSSYLERFLTAGVVIGVATGRGKSIKQELRKRIGEQLWPSVMIGYYNGADIGLLSDDSHPNSTSIPTDILAPVADALRRDCILSRLAECTPRKMQITVEPKHASAWESVWIQVQQVAHQFGSAGITVLRSSHSMDVLAPGVSKKRLVDAVQDLVALRSDSRVLCIGDLGRWPGNDFELLSEPYSLSVDEVSLTPSTCWNLAPAGHRGVQACMDYLHAMKIRDSQLKLMVNRIASKSLR